MRRVLSIVVLLVACTPGAGSTSGPAPEAPSQINRTTGGYDVQLANAAKPVAATLPISPARLWPIALHAYTSLGLRADVVDSVGHRVWTRREAAYHSMAHQRLSSLFDCGSDLTGAIADDWRLQVNALMAVAPAESPDHSSVVMSMVVTATPVGGSSSTVTQCSSRGRLEAMLLDAIHGALRK